MAPRIFRVRFVALGERRRDVVDTERALAWSNVLLERYGIVSREAALAEELPGGFSAIYQVFKTAEEAGRIRRGYFIDGLSGAQFALAGSIDKLRGLRDEEHRDEPVTERDVVTLAAVDPAELHVARERDRLQVRVTAEFRGREDEDRRRRLQSSVRKCRFAGEGLVLRMV